MARPRRREARGSTLSRPPAAVGFELHAPAGSGPTRWSEPAAWMVIAVAALALLWIAFRLHPIGDYATESDFYGGYADGARLFQQGRPDPSRYGVAGPGYDAALALVGFAVGDLFTAARLIAVASAVGTLLLWRSLLARRAGPDLALWAVAIVATNPVFTRYGYSATTDLFSIFLQAAALHAWIASDDRLAPFRGGVLAALAALTRYNAIVLLPLGIVLVLVRGRTAGRPRGRAVLALLGGCALVAGPWLVFSLGAGHVPGASLFANFTTFYTVGDASRNVQDQFPAVADSLRSARSFGRVVADRPLEFLAGMLRNIPDHLVRDGRELLGWPVALLALAGVGIAFAGGLRRALGPVVLAGALLFATLVPVFYSDRYSLALLPMYAALAAAAASSPRFALRLRGVPLKGFLVLAALAWALRANVASQAEVARTLPLEVLEAAAVLERASPPDARVMSRKAHIGHHARRAMVPFPRAGSLAELGGYGRAAGVDYLYFSWFEALSRAEFCYLLDTTAVVPGLTVVATTRRAPGVLYRVGPEFGRDPEWLADRSLHALHRARAILLAPGRRPLREVAVSHMVLAAHAHEARRPADALGHVEFALVHRPDDAGAWRLLSDILRALGRSPEAAAAYRRAQALEPRARPSPADSVPAP